MCGFEIDLSGTKRPKVETAHQHLATTSQSGALGIYNQLPHSKRLFLQPYTQAKEFVLNVEDDTSSDYRSLGGHGFDGTLACGLVRCPEYDATYVTNLGTR